MKGPDAPLDCGCSQTWCKLWNEPNQWCPRRNAAGDEVPERGAVPLTAPESPAAAPDSLALPDCLEVLAARLSDKLSPAEKREIANAAAALRQSGAAKDAP